MPRSVIYAGVIYAVVLCAFLAGLLIGSYMGKRAAIRALVPTQESLERAKDKLREVRERRRIPHAHFSADDPETPEQLRELIKKMNESERKANARP